MGLAPAGTVEGYSNPKNLRHHDALSPGLSGVGGAAAKETKPARLKKGSMETLGTLEVAISKRAGYIDLYPAEGPTNHSRDSVKYRCGSAPFWGFGPEFLSSKVFGPASLSPRGAPLSSNV